MEEAWPPDMCHSLSLLPVLTPPQPPDSCGMNGPPEPVPHDASTLHAAPDLSARFVLADSHGSHWTSTQGSFSACLPSWEPGPSGDLTDSGVGVGTGQRLLGTAIHTPR